MLVRFLDTPGPSIMNVICVVLPIIGIVIGFMKGFVNRSVRVIEGAIIILFSIVLKNPLSSLFYKFVPFFNFKYRVLNILLFELFAYIMIAMVLVVIFHIINKFINIVERIVGILMRIGIPSSILGALVSLGEFLFYLYIFIFIVFLFSNFADKPIESSVANKVYYHMPVLRPMFGDYFDACLDVGKLINSGESSDKINHDAMKSLLYSKFITYDSAKYIIENDKISFKGDEDLIKNYK